MSFLLGELVTNNLLERLNPHIVMTGSDPPFLAAGIPEFNRIIADSDLDGCVAAVLKAANPNAEVHFGTCCIGSFWCFG